jgi:hypothetical protein
MSDKKNAAKVKQLLIMHFLLKGKKLLRSGYIIRWTKKVVFVNNKRKVLNRQPFFISQMILQPVKWPTLHNMSSDFEKYKNTLNN